jgi:DNA invertase Pin-like site-specific DNA recombinase
MGVKGVFQEEFIDQLRLKVLRGMEDAFRQGLNIRCLCFGYKLVPKIENEEFVINAKGKVLMEKAIDDDQATIVREAFDLYAAGTSTTQIARQFNDRKAGGKNTWCASTLATMFARRIYAGEEVDGIRSIRRDPATGKQIREFLPEDKWRRRPAEHLRIVSDELWHKVQERHRACSEVFKARRPGEPGRASLYPKLLFRPLCSYCGTELILGHSGKNPSFFCPTGHERRKNCRIYGYKAVSIIDRSLLAYASHQLIDDAAIKGLVKSANRHLKVEAAKPSEDVTELRVQLKDIESRLKQLVAVADLCHEKPAAIANKVDGISREKAELEKRIQVASAPKTHKLRPLKESDVREMLSDLRGLLATDVKAAAPALRALFGPIKADMIESQTKAGKPVWELRFEWSLAQGITQISLEKGHPTAALLEFLSLSGWTSSEAAVIRLERPKSAQKWAATVQAMAAKGANISVICRVTGLSRAQVREARELKVAVSDSPASITWLGGDGLAAKPAKYKSIAQRVQELRDREQLTFKAIAALIRAEAGDKTCRGTVIKAYNFACNEQLIADFQAGVPQRSRTVRQLKPKAVKRMRTMILKGRSRVEIAKELKCDVKTVANEKVKMRKEGALRA